MSMPPYQYIELTEQEEIGYLEHFCEENSMVMETAFCPSREREIRVLVTSAMAHRKAILGEKICR